MAYTIEVEYFNSFWLKKVVEADKTLPEWPGLPWNPTGYPTFPFDGGTADPCAAHYTPWFVEEARIKGGFNNVTVDFGARAYITEEDSTQIIRTSSLIYSGIYNSTTGINRTNVFSVGEAITRSTDPINGSIQKLYAEDSNLIIFQEHKVNRALIDKDTIYTTEGGTQTQINSQVIGQIVPYLGEWGMARNPESFAIYGYRKYFTDKNRGVVLRLSRDGITEISSYGMKDYFRDQLSLPSNEWSWNNNEIDITTPVPTGAAIPSFDIESTDCCGVEIGSKVQLEYTGGATIEIYPQVSYITRIVDAGSTCTIHVDPSFDFTVPGTLPNAPDKVIIYTQTKGMCVGGWDMYNKDYVLSIQTTPSYIGIPDETLITGNYSTLNFDESVLGWTSFYTYKPTLTDSLQGNFYSFYSGEVWKHNDENSILNRGSFYGSTSNANITFLFNNNPSITKNFLTVNYEGSNGWEIDSFISSEQGPDLVGGTYVNTTDLTASVRSYDEGTYTNSGITYHAGFDRKENRYVANLVNDSSQQIGEVIFGTSMSGIKGYFAEVKISTDASTEVGGMKELFAVSSSFVISSR